MQLKDLASEIIYNLQKCILKFSLNSRKWNLYLFLKAGLFLNPPVDTDNKTGRTPKVKT